MKDLTDQDLFQVCKRLRETNDPVTDIIADVGINSSQFNQWFQSQMRMTASEFRKKHLDINSAHLKKIKDEHLNSAKDKDFQDVCRRLAETDDEIRDIRKDLGMHGPEFNEWFQSRAKMTASEYRTRIRAISENEDYIKFLEVRREIINSKETLSEISKSFNIAAADFAPWFYFHQGMTPKSFQGKCKELTKEGWSENDIEEHFNFMSGLPVDFKLVLTKLKRQAELTADL